MKQLLLFASLCLLTLSLSFAQSQKVILKGLIIDDKGAPLQDVTIKVLDSIGVRKTILKTDQRGQFVTNTLPEGNYKLIASYIGYKETTKEVQLTTNTATQIEFILSQDIALNEVVITAGRKPESIDEVPSSISILNAQEVKEQTNVNPSIATILGNTIPGLGTGTNKATNSGQTLRGRQVLVLIDGIPQSTPLMNGARDIRTLDPAVIERVEVIKGATSIYGNGSGGGIINFITKTPAVGKRFGGTTSIGTSGNLVHPSNTIGYRISQLFEGSIDKFSYVVSGTYNYTGVLKDAKGEVNAQADGLGENNLYNTFIKLAYKPNEHSALTASYNLFRSVQHSDYVNVVGKYRERPSIGVKGDDPGEPAGTPYNHNVFLSYHHDALPYRTSLDITAYYNRFVSMNRYVEQGTAWYGPGQTKIQSFKKGLRLNLNTPWAIHDDLQAELTYGLDLLNDRTNQILTDGRVYIPDMDMVNLAPYAQLKLDLWNHLVLKGGVRYENANVKVKDFNTIATGPNGEGSIAVSGGKIPYHATMFNVGLRYNKYDFLNPFISFSQGFAINELGRILRRATQSTLESIETDPIITNNYELGISSRFDIFHLTAAYYISTSKFGANLVDVGGYLVPQREPERVYGYEVTADAFLSPQWTVGASYSFVEGKSEQEDGTKVYMNGIRIAPPKATAYIAFCPSSEFDLKLNWVYTGDRNRFEPRSNGLYANSEGPVDAVSLLNLSALYRINNKFSLGMGVENLLNSSYYPVVSQYRAIDAEYVRGNGATLTMNLSYNF
ncbi:MULTISPECIES: TonB-dependent receptor [Olivibacter]|jgi:iron complex outermembrane receptor protein|uniref:TonB-dependent receptor n=2 Tax=Olivibacter TaxID=376469 RepID=A0ABV6HSG4_9SPHI|nr:MULTISPECIES: TonB-dependent receptor [Olivibacter]MCL4639930.1 TonB-dependent receptor [Olivibacter sp. UJ_SKK_5.1]MDM8174401.1 TonB-dependent receptor [Olivibacter sp. 47]MDX3916656.1 TonB-dependent receptor [Pseudosphingobacterium sp.]QEL01274.1 ferric aerobactin receptor [Olivibacter sp. LS-1]